ncbi:hypothetical protein [Gracilimonas tropica]|uniref:hypothetical protein n=1 Tax=Gracilimonas tropica TaxID=454600 RepID=UPI000366C69F|nr:hypothetical protein [Gracilimonas tropica]
MRSEFVLDTSSGLHGMDDYLKRTSQNALKLFAGKLQDATSGRRGQLATIGLNLANLTTSKAGINGVYEQNAGVIDAYFEHVDLVALSEKLASAEPLSGSAKSTLVKYGSSLLIGIIIGVLVHRTFNSSTK